MSTSNNFDKTVQDTLDAVGQRYKEVEAWLQKMEKDNDEIHSLGMGLHYYTKVRHWTVVGVSDVGPIMGWKTVLEERTNHTIADDINKDRQDIKNLADDIANATHQTDGSSPFDALVQSIKGCEDAVTTVQDDIKNNHDEKGIQLLVDDLGKIDSTLQKLVKALAYKVAAQKDEDAISDLAQNGGSPEEVSSVVEQLIKDHGKESDVLWQMRSEIDGNMTECSNQSDNADADGNNIRWWDYLLSDNDVSTREADNETIKKAAEDMMDFFGEIESATVPELASLTSNFTTQISAMLDQIIKKIAELLNSNLSPEEKEKRLMQLRGEIMDLFVVVIGLLTIVQQDATKEKAKNEAVMSEATNRAAGMGSAHSRIQMKKITDNLEYASIMGTLTDVCKYTMMAVMTLAAPGIGSALVGALMIVLEASGAVKKLTDALVKAGCSQIAADCIVGGIEMVLTMGGGALLDAGLKVMMTSMMKGALEQTVKQIAKEAGDVGAKEIAKATDTITEDAAKDLIENSVKLAGEQAAKKVFVMCSQRNMVAMLTGDSCKKMMFTAAKEAAESAAKREVAVITRLAAEGVTAQGLAKVATKVAIKEGDAAAANTLKVSLKAIEKVSLKEGWGSTAGAAARRGAFSSLYAVGSNNIPVDLVKAAKKPGESDSDDEVLMISMQVLQTLMMLIGQLGGTGMASQLFSDMGAESSAMFSKLTNALTPVTSLGQGGADLGQAEIEMNQADARTKLGKIQAVVDILMQLNAPKIQARREQESKNDTAESIGQMKGLFDVAGHMNDYLNTASQVMIAG